MRARLGLWLGALLLLLVIAGGALTTPVLAGDDEAREVAEVKRQIEALRREAGALKEEGHLEEAREVWKRAEDLSRRLEAYFKRQKRKEHAEHGEKKHRSQAEMKRMHAILRGLAQGMEALHALGKKDDAAHLREIYEGLMKRIAKSQPKREKRSERQVVEGWIELMGYAVKVLVKADREEHAELLEHAKHAYELALAGKHDERSNKIRKSAPSRLEQADCLLLAAEILHDKGDERHAKLMADLGRQWQKQQRRRKAKKEHADREHEGEGLESLATRVEILQMALPALREGERKRAAAILERAIRTGKVMLAEREDEEALEIRAATPPLNQLAEVLHLASDLWAKFGNEKKAKLTARLAHRYAEQWRAQQEEREHEEHAHGEEGHDEDAEREHRRHRAEDERAEQLAQLQRQMEEIREALEHLQKQLRALTRDK